MGINQKNKSKKLDKVERERRRFDRELRDCMHCKFFWGNNHRCAMNKCCKTKQETVTEKKKPEIKKPASECDRCPYNNGSGYCFPCMKKILGK